MRMHVVARSHVHRHRLPYFSGRGVRVFVCQCACAHVSVCLVFVCLPRFLGEESPRQLEKSMPMHVVARNRTCRHIFPDFPA